MTTITSTGRKVVFGFFVATIFLIAVAGLTYISLNRLVESVDQLAQPNQKLDLLNSLQEEVFKITQIGSESSINDVRIKDSTILFLETKLSKLDTLSSDTVETRSIQSIRENLALLINGYQDLYDVKRNLSNRNFSQEALRRLEISIRRRALALETQPLRELNPRQLRNSELQQQAQANLERQSSVLNADEDRIIRYLQQFQKQNAESNSQSKTVNLDSVLYSLSRVMGRIYREESVQRQNLARLESDIFQKQATLTSTIQALIGDLQAQTIQSSNEQSRQAASLVSDVTFFLIMVVVLAVLSTLALIYSILKEIRINRRYQEDLEVSRQKSEELARSKQEFLANMSHEIRNPLHLIQGYGNVLKKTPLNSDQLSHLQMIGFASDTLKEIVDDILDFSKLEAGKLKLDNYPFDPIGLFENIQNFFELSAKEKKLGFEWNIELPENQWLIGDELRLKQILNNLLSNAFKFTKKGGIDVSIKWKSGMLFLEVKDSGIGMKPKELEKVFQEFDQADTSVSRRFGGTGLGLAIVKRLVDLMKGELKVESEYGKGTLMHVSIPMQTSPVPEWTDTKSNAETVDLTGIQVLLVDDDAVGLKYLQLVLEYFGAEVKTYQGGVSFRDSFSVEPFDFALIDIQMPEISGYEVVKSLKSMDFYSQLPVLAMTANVFVEEKEKLQNQGFQDVILKPFQEKELVEKLGILFPERTKAQKIEGNTQPNDMSMPYQLNDLEKFCMGDEELLQDIIKDLIRTTEADLVKLSKARLNDRWDEMLEICHQLGSRLGQIKSPASPFARKVENSLKINNKSGIIEPLNTLDQLTRETLQALKDKINQTA
ncbi:ATP-binding protein [Algoriphagus sp. AK58]|uniref:ATP-binding protein n=1 Tax=Algoriphagus sp. AK58 TaxID=1406877 RepID=UPI00164FCAD5|nr:ATP-binding protein [Algoriphagus sp. AK58]